MTNRCPDRAKKKRSGNLRALWSSVKVKSCADGSMKIEPVWKGVKPYTEEDGGGPGLLTRLAGAASLQVLIDQHLKGKS